jgi:hypothetical protein
MEYGSFVGPTYQLQNISANCQRCINLYPQADESGAGKGRAYLLSTPGLVRVADLTGTAAGGIRGTYTASNERLFAVVGAFLVELGATGAILGTYPLPGETGTGLVSMTDNGRDMLICTGPNAYWFHFAANGGIGTMILNAGGTGWAVGDVFTANVGAGGTGTIAAVGAGGVATAITFTSGGSGYVSAAGSTTTASLPSLGIGLTVDITVVAANTLTQVTDEVFQGAGSCGFIDGYIVFSQPGTQIFWITNIYSTVINPLGFASAEGAPDNLITLLVDHREIWLFSDIHTEVWYDSGNANFPFAAIQGAFISHGIAAAKSAVRLDNTTFWIGNDEFGQGVVLRANGYAPLRVSNFAIEQAMQRYPTIADAVAWTYQQDGHSFYVINFPSGDATWAYDAASGMWHERAYLGTLAINDGQLHRGRANTHSFAFGRHIVGDWQTGYLYQLTPAAYDDDGRQIQRLRRAPYIDNELRRIFFAQFQLDLEVGQGNPGAVEPVAPPAEPVDPQISLRWSDDGGYTWSGYKTISMGVSGQYRKRVVWRRLGYARSRTFEVSTGQHGIGLSLYNAYLELQGVQS